MNYRHEWIDHVCLTLVWASTGSLAYCAANENLDWGLPLFLAVLIGGLLGASFYGLFQAVLMLWGIKK